MNATPTALPEVLLIEPKVFGDDRGFFLESWNEGRFNAALGYPVKFVQDNHSRSARGVLRGLHYQLPPHPQGKLVQASLGEVFDVAVDIRRGSPSFGRWFGVVLSGENHLQLYVPPGFAHGFCVLSETALFAYKCTDFYHPETEHSLRFDDPDLGIDWPLPGQPTLSGKDEKALRLKDFPEAQLPIYVAP